MNILITGVSGFLGNNLVKLLKNQFEIIGITSETEVFFTEPSIKLYNKDSIDLILEEPSIIIMCHASVSSGNIRMNNEQLFVSNVKFTEKIINLFPNSHFIYISSVSVYGNNIEPINESTLLNPQNEYAVSKLWGEKITSSALSSSILRISSLYGIGMKENTILPVFINQALINGKIEVWGDGERKQNYLHISDALSYIEKLIRNRLQGVFLATSKTEISNLDLANIIKSITKTEVFFKYSDNSFSNRYSNIVTREKLNISKDLELLDGIKDYIKWKKKQF